MPRLVEAFGTFGVTQALHVWRREDGGGLMVGVPSYDHNRGGAFVAFAASDAQEVLALARMLARWALDNGASADTGRAAGSPATDEQIAALTEGDWAPGGGQ